MSAESYYGICKKCGASLTQWEWENRQALNCECNLCQRTKRVERVKQAVDKQILEVHTQQPKLKILSLEKQAFDYIEDKRDGSFKVIKVVMLEVAQKLTNQARREVWDLTIQVNNLEGKIKEANKPCEGHHFWKADTPMKERLTILSEKSIFCPYCGKRLCEVLK